MAVSTNSPSLSDAFGGIPVRVAPSPFPALVLAAAGMVQRWRQQTRAACKASRSWRATKAAAAKRAERDRLPPASRARSVAHFEALALASTAEAHAAEAQGDLVMAENHHAEAAWFSSKARNMSGLLA